MENIYLTTIFYNQKGFCIYGNQSGEKKFLELKNNILISPQEED